MADDSSKTTTGTAAAPGAPADSDKKLQQVVDRLLARAPAISEGTVHPKGRPGPLRYEARVEFLPVTAQGFEGASGDAQAAVMVTSYRRQGSRSPDRPVCFAFNGGPGRAGPQARGRSRRRFGRPGAVPGGRQPAHLVRPFRSRLH